MAKKKQIYTEKDIEKTKLAKKLFGDNAKVKDLRNPYQKHIQDILENNTTNKKVENLSELTEKFIDNLDTSTKPARVFAAGAGSAITSAPSATLGLLYGIGSGVSGGLTNLFLDDKYQPTKTDIFLDAIDNKGFETAGKIDDAVRDALGTPRYDELTRGEQILDFAGSLVNPNSIIKKGATKIAPTLAKKLTPKTNMQKFIVNSVTPGLQITKGSTIPQKIAEIGAQTIPQLGLNEFVRNKSQQQGIFGDYRPKDEEKIQSVLFKDGRTIKGDKTLDQIHPKNYEILDLDAERDDNAAKEILTNTGLALSTVFAPKAITKAYKAAPKAIRSDKLTSFIQKQKQLSETGVSDFEKAIPLSEKLDIRATDRMAFRNTAEKMNLINEQTKVDLARSISQRTDSAFNTGLIKNINGSDIDFGVAPRQTKIMLRQLQLTDTSAYDDLENYIESVSRLQDQINRINIKNGTKYDLKEYLENINLDQYKTDFEQVSNMMKTVKALKPKIEQNPVTNKIINDISKISDGLLNLMEKSGDYTPEQIAYLRKNRTITGQLLYKPRVAKKSSKTLADWTHDLFFNREPTSHFSDVFIKYRGADKAIMDAESYYDVMEKSIKNFISSTLDNNVRYNTLKDFEQSSKNNIKQKYLDKLEQIKNRKSYESLPDLDFFKDMNAIHLGYEDLSTNTLDKNVNDLKFTDLLNIKEDNALTKHLNNEYSENLGKLSKAIESKRLNKDNIITVIHDGKRHYYQVTKTLKDAFDIDTKMPSLFYEMGSRFKTFTQGTITGFAANPTFFIRGAKYSQDEALSLMSTISKELDVKDPSIGKTILNYSKAFKESYANQKANLIADDWAKEFVKTGGKFDTKQSRYLKDLTEENIRANVTKNLLTQLQLEGAKLDKPINITQSGKFYNMSKISLNKVTKMLANTNLDMTTAEKHYNTLKAITDAVRSTPTVSMAQQIGEKQGSIIDNIIKDKQKIGKFVEAFNKYTANTGSFGSGKGISGSISKWIRDLVPYGDVMEQSLASKLRATTFVKDTKEILNDWIDPEIRYVDFFNKIGSSMSKTAKNKFVQSTFKTVGIPATIAYMYNHANQENRDAYYSLSNYDKAKGIILVNFFGDGLHAIIPIDQELGIMHNMYNMLLDTTFSMSKEQDIDPAFTNMQPLKQSLSRSMQIDTPPLIRAGFASLGYKISPSAMFTDDTFLTPMKNVTNSDMSQTAYENGVFNAEQTEFFAATAGRWGQLLTSLIENTNKDNVSVPDIIKNTAKDYVISGGKLWTDRVNTYNDTSKAVYDYQNKLATIGMIKNKNPKQNEVFDTVKLYNKNRIRPIHEAIKSVRREIQTLRTTSKTDDGTILNINDTKDAVNSLNKKLIKLYSLEYKEIQNLDNYLEQMYGKDINFNNFMQTFAN